MCKAPIASLLGPTWCFLSSGLCPPTPSRSPHISTCGARWASTSASPTWSRARSSPPSASEVAPTSWAEGCSGCSRSRTPCRRPLPTRSVCDGSRSSSSSIVHADLRERKPGSDERHLGEEMSDHFDNGRFFNPNGTNGQPFWNAPRMLFERGTPWPAQVPVVQRPSPPPTSGDEITITFIGHATFLIQTSAGNIITDPVFAQRAGPVGWVGPRRVRQPGVRFDDLPPIAYVLLSHNHYDHCDLETLRALQHRDHPRIVTLQGNATLLRSAGVTRIAELDWWQRMPAEMSAKRGAQTLDPAATPGREIEITATQAQHFSARTPFDRNRALWGGFMITIDEQQIYFAGDSGYGPHFLEIGRRFPRIDLALIPIGAYEPRWFMKDIHMNPEEAVQAHMDVGARRSIGMHFGTYRLTTEGPNEPVAALGRARSAAGIDAAAFTTLDLCESARL